MRITSPVIALSLLFGALSVVEAQTQNGAPGMETRPRTVGAELKPGQAAPAAQQESAAKQKSTTSDGGLTPRFANSGTTSVGEISGAPTVAARQSGPAAIRARIAEAERLLKTRPRPTAITSPALDTVTLALFEPSAARIHLLSISKQIFLIKGSEASLTTSRGTLVTLRVLRANGVNTAVTAVDDSGRSLMPLVVEFPIERQGVFKEMAYYTSAHPALLSA